MPDGGEDAPSCEEEPVDCQAAGGCGWVEDRCGELVDCGLCPGEERLELRPDELVLSLGERAELRAVWRSLEGERAVEQELRWSSDSAAVEVDASGQVQAISYGEGVIRASSADGGQEARARVAVAAPLARLELSLESSRVHVGAEGVVEVAFFDALEAPTAARALRWESSDESVLRVDDEGRVQGIASGRAQVSAQAGEVRASLEVEVYFVWRDVTPGEMFSCGLSGARRAYCWGANEAGQLGDGTTEARAEPREILGGLRFEALSAGKDFVCGIGAQGGVYCWGNNAQGQSGQPIGEETRRVLEPTQVIRRTAAGAEALELSRMDSGLAYTCGVHDASARVYCWGINNSGQIGRVPADGYPGVYDSPMVIGGDAYEAVLVATAYPVGCATSPSGEVACWGWQKDLLLSLVDEEAPDVIGEPMPLATQVAFVQMAGARRHFCGLDVGGQLYCWGRNGLGQLGTGDQATSGAPVEASTEARFQKISIGASHGCAVTLDGSEVHCWGDSRSGQAGPSQDRVLAPVPVTLSEGSFVDVGAGGQHSCALAASGRLYCFGRGDEGQCGPGEGAVREVPGF
ncbi:Ig-like domain-containing protein [Lujinxingia litoralis]|uniref:Ig-like domain-containing protein n=1 Tax=Lujinxingia litoralis TaxID=2211119 RepID=UPI001313F827|nr:Ig-like domain-containing protein [Lujinxingia litoralis]